MDANYIPIRVSTLRGNLPIDFDAFVKINEKFLLYVRKGDSFEGPRLKRLRDKNLKQMYILQREEPLYRAYVLRNLELGFSSAGDLPTRVEIVQGILQSNTESMIESPSDVESYDKTKDDCERFVRFLDKEPEALSLLLEIENIDKSIAHHGVSVSTLATGLAKELKCFDARQMQLIALGSLLHDIAHFESKIDTARPRSSFSETEESYFRNHPYDGAQKVQGLKHFDDQVIRIIAQHEEFMDGNGFPVGLTGKEMDPLSMVVAAANALDRMIAFEGVPRAEAAKKFPMQCLGKYPLDYIKILSDLIRR